jgi:hypothetical protein
MKFPNFYLLFCQAALCLLAAGALQAQSGEAPADTIAQAPVIAPLVSSYDFGEVLQGEKVSFSFEYSNQGRSPLKIKAVQTACPCTKATWEVKKALALGEKATIKVVFDTAGQKGPQKRTFLVISNAQNPEVLLYLTGTVKEK